MLISVIVTTYNRPLALERVLAGLTLQTDSDFEVVVADDGSGPQTKDLLARWERTRSSGSLMLGRKIWGFASTRAAIMVSDTVAATTSLCLTATVSPAKPSWLNTEN